MCLSVRFAKVEGIRVARYKTVTSTCDLPYAAEALFKFEHFKAWRQGRERVVVMAGNTIEPKHGQCRHPLQRVTKDHTCVCMHISMSNAKQDTKRSSPVVEALVVEAAGTPRHHYHHHLSTVQV